MGCTLYHDLTRFGIDCVISIKRMNRNQTSVLLDMGLPHNSYAFDA